MIDVASSLSQRNVNIKVFGRKARFLVTAPLLNKGPKVLNMLYMPIFTATRRHDRKHASDEKSKKRKEMEPTHCQYCIYRQPCVNCDPQLMK